MRPFWWSHYFLIFADWFVKSHIHFPGFSQHFFLVMFALTPVGPTICALVALPGLAFPGYLWPSGRPMLMMAIWHNMGMALVVVHTFLETFTFCMAPIFTLLLSSTPLQTNRYHLLRYQTSQYEIIGTYCTTHFTKKSPLLLRTPFSLRLNCSRSGVCGGGVSETRTWTDFARREKKQRSFNSDAKLGNNKNKKPQSLLNAVKYC